MRDTMCFRVLVLMAVTASASAHHSRSVYYDMSRTVEITGAVVEWRFRSPHAFLSLEVTEQDGSVERWAIDGSSVPTLRRQGLDQNSFAPGDVVTVFGQPSRDPNTRLAFAQTFVTADGRTLGERLALDEGVRLESDVQGVKRLEGRWQGLGMGASFRSDGESPLPLSAAGREAWESYDDELSPASTCEPINTPALLHAPNFLFDVRISDEEATLYHEIYEVTRTVPLDSAPRQAEPSGIFGFVRGRVEGEELVVESSRFPPSLWGLAVAAIPPGNGGDVPSSAEKRVTERYSARDGGQTLRVEYTVEDPVYLTEPYTGYRDFARVSDDTPLHPYGCDAVSASRFSERE